MYNLDYDSVFPSILFQQTQIIPLTSKLCMCPNHFINCSGKTTNGTMDILLYPMAESDVNGIQVHTALSYTTSGFKLYKLRDIVEIVIPDSPTILAIDIGPSDRQCLR